MGWEECLFECSDDCLKATGIYLVKRSKAGTVNVENGNDGARLVMNGNYNFRT